jgi:hypothetical protein
MSEYQDRIHHLKGSPFEIGYAMGQSLGPKLGANIERYIRERLSPETPFDAERWRSGALPWMLSLPARFLEEFEGLAQGARLPMQRIAEWAYLECFLSGQCSGAILTIDHLAWVARNNDIFAPGMWGYVTIREVSNRIPAISFGLEGDVFTPTGINREKLWLHYNYLPAWDVPIAGRPALPCYAFIIEALETCQTLPNLEALLRRIVRDEAMLLFAADGKDNSYALYECGCTDFVKVEPSRGWLVGTNHCCFYPGAPTPGNFEPLSSASRYARLETLVERLATQRSRTSPVREIIQILADDGIESRTGNIMTAYSNVACPATGEIWYTFGGYPAASRGDWQKLAWPW